MSGPVWHRAAATIGADEEVARELDAIAEDAQRRGAIAAAVEALERAAELTGDSDLTAGCLLGAAEWAGGAGRLDVVACLLRAAEPFTTPGFWLCSRMRLRSTGAAWSSTACPVSLRTPPSSTRCGSSARRPRQSAPSIWPRDSPRRRSLPYESRGGYALWPKRSSCEPGPRSTSGAGTWPCRRGGSRPAGAGDRAPIWGGGAKVALSILAGLRGRDDVRGRMPPIGSFAGTFVCGATLLCHEWATKSCLNRQQSCYDSSGRRSSGDHRAASWPSRT
jgi:hypothetical protein